MAGSLGSELASILKPEIHTLDVHDLDPEPNSTPRNKWFTIPPRREGAATSSPRLRYRRVKLPPFKTASNQLARATSDNYPHRQYSIVIPNMIETGRFQKCLLTSQLEGVGDKTGIKHLGAELREA